jgi:hypothetical protein
LTYNNPPSDVESDCIGEVQAPSNVEEEHMHAAYGATNLARSKFRFVGENVAIGEVARSARLENLTYHNKENLCQHS